MASHSAQSATVSARSLGAQERCLETTEARSQYLASGEKAVQPKQRVAATIWRAYTMVNIFEVDLYLSTLPVRVYTHVYIYIYIFLSKTRNMRVLVFILSSLEGSENAQPMTG